MSALCGVWCEDIGVCRGREPGRMEEGECWIQGGALAGCLLAAASYVDSDLYTVMKCTV